MTTKKNLDDYMNDPDIINEPMALREVHAIRLMIHDETRNMTRAERSAYFHQATKDLGIAAVDPSEVREKLMQTHNA